MFPATQVVTSITKDVFDGTSSGGSHENGGGSSSSRHLSEEDSFESEEATAAVAADKVNGGNGGDPVKLEYVELEADPKAVEEPITLTTDNADTILYYQHKQCFDRLMYGMAAHSTSPLSSPLKSVTPLSPQKNPLKVFSAPLKYFSRFCSPVQLY